MICFSLNSPPMTSNHRRWIYRWRKYCFTWSCC